MISLKNVNKNYGEHIKALIDVSLKVQQGEFVYLVGPSGAGKSTLLRMLTREELPTSGSIQIGNMHVEKLALNRLYLLRRQIGIVMQKDLFIPYYSVFENIIYCLEALGVMGPQKKERALEVLELVGMTASQDKKLTELSIGQQKKVAIARAIVNKPFVLIADEPTANLDPRSSAEIMKLFLRLNQRGTTVIMATHDSTMVNSLRKRVLELQGGRLIRDDHDGGYTSYADPKDIYIW
ncbi:cell division ATP-binding protein FtsE [Liquorilactobacillus capillatus]|uniref:Cell division ATP-binding protein FtsE n=2 Tax=Liquorilactobacillus capillatus TaxID=480931 RepID=A0A0R1M242_9LACO|nr:ATP-binding cassette domain-containing protein [Liquorilactobacillus capillatus]AJA33883.1 cell division protein FtsE [Liquorilactobacillus capillatus]KRL02095.1 cell division ATP-binding protein FtsE [Liquorilactobacillus capillatus DSM 19910]